MREKLLNSVKLIPEVIPKYIFENAKITAVDISKKALKVATQNSKFHNFEGDFLRAEATSNSRKINEKHDLCCKVDESLSNSCSFAPG